jgi:hypothetical protein
MLISITTLSRVNHHEKNMQEVHGKLFLILGKLKEVHREKEGACEFATAILSKPKSAERR